MKKALSVVTVLVVSCVAVVGVIAWQSSHVLAQQDTGISDQVAAKMAMIAAIKQQFTSAQQKVDSNLVFAAKAASGELAGTGVDTVPSVQSTPVDANGYVDVDINANVSPAVLDAIAAVNGTVTNSSPQFGFIRASLPLG